MNSKARTGLLVLFAVLLLLFNQPLLAISSGWVRGIPGPMIYLGFVWLVLIIVMHRLAVTHKKGRKY